MLTFDAEEMYNEYGIGRTPIREVPDGYLPGGNKLYLKAEYEQAGGSAKARTVYYLIKDYMVSTGGTLEGKTVIESTSGNTGAAIAHFGKLFGYHPLLIVDATCPTDKINALRSKGAEVEVLEVIPGEDMRNVRINYVQRMTREKGHIWLNQYENPAGARAHITTAEEILKEMTPDYIFSPAGTGATLSGILQGVKKEGAPTRCVGVEPYGSHVFSAEGPTENFLNFGPGNQIQSRFLSGLDFEHMQTPDEDTIHEAIKFNRETGVSAGMGTGMCLAAMKRYITENGITGKTFVVIGSDRVDGYRKFLEGKE